MNEHVNLSEQLPEITTDIFTTATVVVGLRGSGKTNDGVVMAEESVHHGVPSVIVDPTGVWYGLKSSPDGKSAGLPFYIFGGQHADVPLEPSAGPIIARFVVDEQVPIILDLSDLSKGKQVRFVGQFSEALYDLKARKKDPLLVIYDEAPRFIPQLTRGASPDLAICMGAVEDVFVLGRSRGIGGVLISPRLATLNKNVACAADNLIVMRSIGTPDRKAIDEWVTEAQAEQNERNELIQNMAALKQGEGYFWSPAMFNVFRRVTFAKRTTFDSSRTPKVGEKRITPTVFASVDLDALRGEIAAAAERMKADDPKALRARIAELEKQVREKPNIGVEIVEVQVVLEAERKELKEIAHEIDEFSTFVISKLQTMQTVSKQIVKSLQDVWLKQEVRSEERRVPQSRTEAINTAPAIVEQREAPRRSVDGATNGKPIGKAERAILTVLAQHGASSAQFIALRAGYSVNGGGFRNALGSLRSSGYIERGDPVAATHEGIMALGAYIPLPKGRELLEYWQGQLGKAERTILGVLAQAYPQTMTIDAVAKEADYEAGGGGFRNALGRLRTLTLIEGRNPVRASSSLFD